MSHTEDDVLGLEPLTILAGQWKHAFGENAEHVQSVATLTSKRVVDLINYIIEIIHGVDAPKWSHKEVMRKLRKRNDDIWDKERLTRYQTQLDNGASGAWNACYRLTYTEALMLLVHLRPEIQTKFAELAIRVMTAEQLNAVFVGAIAETAPIATIEDYEDTEHGPIYSTGDVSKETILAYLAENCSRASEELLAIAIDGRYYHYTLKEYCKRHEIDVNTIMLSQMENQLDHLVSMVEDTAEKAPINFTPVSNSVSGPSLRKIVLDEFGDVEKWYHISIIHELPMFINKRRIYRGSPTNRVNIANQIEHFINTTIAGISQLKITLIESARQIPTPINT